MAEFFKNYGAAIGPTIAFALGFIALSVKYSWDHKNERKKSLERLGYLKSIIRACKPDENLRERNGRDNERMFDPEFTYRLKERLAAATALAERVESDLCQHGTAEELWHFFVVKTALKRYLQRVEFQSSEGKIPESGVQAIRDFHSRAVKACDAKIGPLGE